MGVQVKRIEPSGMEKLASWVNTIAPVDGKTVRVGWEGTNYGFRTEAFYTGNELAQGTECKMVRP